MSAGTIAAIWRYPVKSMRGEELSHVSISERGLPGDRAVALIDRETGKVASAKHPRRWGKLLECRARVLGFAESGAASLQIALPDERTIVTGQEDVDDMLSEFFGRPVRLASAAPQVAETEREYPEVEGLPVSGKFFSGEIDLGAPPGTFFDYAPVHLLTTATLAHLRRVAPNGDFDPQRFRPNLVIATPGDIIGFAENDWVGRTLLLGDQLRLRITDPTPRCVMPTLPQADLPRDSDILRTIAAHNRPPIPTLGNVTWPSAGVYATVEQGGRVKSGDLVRFMEG